MQHLLHRIRLHAGQALPLRNNSLESYESASETAFTFDHSSLSLVLCGELGKSTPQSNPVMCLAARVDPQCENASRQQHGHSPKIHPKGISLRLFGGLLSGGHQVRLFTIYCDRSGELNLSAVEKCRDEFINLYPVPCPDGPIDKGLPFDSLFLSNGAPCISPNFWKDPMIPLQPESMPVIAIGRHREACSTRPAGNRLSGRAPFSNKNAPASSELEFRHIFIKRDHPLRALFLFSRCGLILFSVVD